MPGAGNSVVAVDEGKTPATHDQSRSTQRGYPQVPKDRLIRPDIVSGTHSVHEYRNAA